MSKRLSMLPLRRESEGVRVAVAVVVIIIDVLLFGSVDARTAADDVDALSTSDSSLTLPPVAFGFVGAKSALSSAFFISLCLTLVSLSTSHSQACGVAVVQ